MITCGEGGGGGTAAAITDGCPWKSLKLGGGGGVTV